MYLKASSTFSVSVSDVVDAARHYDRRAAGAAVFRISLARLSHVEDSARAVGEIRRDGEFQRRIGDRTQRRNVSEPLTRSERRLLRRLHHVVWFYEFAFAVVLADSGLEVRDIDTPAAAFKETPVFSAVLALEQRERGDDVGTGKRSRRLSTAARAEEPLPGVRQKGSIRTALSRRSRRRDSP